MRLVILWLIISVGSATVLAQAKIWRIQFPCDKSFSVEVPAPLYEVSWFEGKHGPSIEPDQDFEKGINAFVALQGMPKKRQFGVVVVHVPRAERRALQKREFGGAYFVIGGDDATPTSEMVIRVNGLTALCNGELGIEKMEKLNRAVLHVKNNGQDWDSIQHYPDDMGLSHIKGWIAC